MRKQHSVRKAQMALHGRIFDGNKVGVYLDTTPRCVHAQSCVPVTSSEIADSL